MVLIMGIGNWVETITFKSHFCHAIFTWLYIPPLNYLQLKFWNNLVKSKFQKDSYSDFRRAFAPFWIRIYFVFFFVDLLDDVEFYRQRGIGVINASPLALGSGSCHMLFEKITNYECTNFFLFLTSILLACHKKSYSICVEFSKYYLIFICLQAAVSALLAVSVL